MENGRIETQGTIKELRARGVLDSITSEAEAQAAEEKAPVDEKTDAEMVADEAVGEPTTTTNVSDGTKTSKTKKPRKLVEKEQRQTGCVKWNIYNIYLKVS